MKRTTLYISVLLIMLAGCYKDIELYQDNDVEQKPVIYSYLNTDSVIKVFVTSTAYPGQLDTSIWLDNAIVNIYENGQLVDNSPVFKRGVLEPYDPYACAYVSSLKPKQGYEYTVEVQALNQTASASTVMPEAVPISDFQAISIALDTGEVFTGLVNVSGSFKVSFNDPANQENYYMLTIFTQSPLIVVTQDDTIRTVENVSLISSGQNSSSGLVVQMPPGYINGMAYVFSDLRYNGQEVTFLINVWGNIYTPLPSLKIYAALIGIDKSLYEYYINEHENRQSRMSPFSEASNIYSNVNGGYGLVGGMTVSKDSIIIPLK